MVRVTVVKFVVGVVVKTSVVVRFRFGFEFMVKIIVKIVWGALSIPYGLPAMTFFPYRYGQASQIQNQSRVWPGWSVSLSWSRSWSVSVSWSVSGSMSLSLSRHSTCGHGSLGGPPLSPMDYLL